VDYLSPVSISRTDPRVTPAAASAGERASFDVVVTRGALIESTHRVHVAVVDSNGTLQLSARDARFVTWWRSCAKPFQLLPFLESGALDQLSWGDDEIALACASHGGEPEHVAIAGQMLSSIGLEEGDLACGPHEPLTPRGARLLRDSGSRPTRLHNNCSGKHAAMLAFARSIGAPTTGYEHKGHPVQQVIRRVIDEWSGTAPDEVLQAVDGCGVVVFGLPLYNMALAYARFAGSANRGDAAPKRIVRAMTGSPFLVGGTDRFDTVLMEAADGRIMCKVGAEGVHTVALLDRNIGIAVKVEDGSPRAQYMAVMGALMELDVFPDGVPEPLREYVVKPVRNTRGEQVGEMRLVRNGNIA
jgi:L-asparaginase II